jgi:bifunctional non-homologous end joining protein LigD
MESSTLFFKQGSSDKVYQTAIQPSGDGFLVTFAYGRRGTTLTTGNKTPTAVNYDAAKAIYDKLIKEKTAKGYTPGEDGTPYQHTDKKSTGILPQLLNPIEETEVERLIVDPNYWMQEKWDGRRLMLRKQDSLITGINKLGLAVAVAESLRQEATNCRLDMILDGEGIDDSLWVFDVLSVGDDEIGGSRYGERYLRLMNLLASFQHRHIHLVETYYTEKQKREAFNSLKAANAEGIVFKTIDAPYVAGRPASGGTQLKFQFRATASFIVSKVNAKRSVSLQLLDGKTLVGAGNVTIPPNHEIPQPGQFVECRYLYAYKESGSIFQPVYLGVRDDIEAGECTVAQLKFKAA